MLQALGARLLDAAGERAAARRRRRWPTSTAVDLSGLHPAAGRRADRRGLRRRQPAARPARRRRGVRAAEGRDPGRRRHARRGAGHWADVRRRRHRRPDRPRRGRAPAPPAGSASPRWPCSAPSCEPGHRAGARPRRLRRPPARGRPGGHRRGLARRADPARQGPGRGGRGGRAPPASRSSRSSGRLAAGRRSSCRRRGSPPPTPSPTSNPTCGAAWPTPARCSNAWPRRWPVERIGGTTP